MKHVLLVFGLFLVFSLPADAKPADPVNSQAVVASAPSFPCHWFFQPDGSADVLIINVALEDASGAPCEGEPVSAVFQVIGTNPDICPAQRVQNSVSGTLGTTFFLFDQIMGCGEFAITVQSGAFVRNLGPFLMTSTDLDASGNVNVVDLGIWAGSLPPNPLSHCADINCSGPPLNVIDLGLWAGGLGLACP